MSWDLGKIFIRILQLLAGRSWENLSIQSNFQNELGIDQKRLMLGFRVFFRNFLYLLSGIPLITTATLTMRIL